MRTNNKPQIDYESYVGKKINHLTVLEYKYTPDHPQRWKRYQFKLQCDCGNIDWKKCNAFVNNLTQTCGNKDCPYKVNSSVTAIEQYKKYIGQRFDHIVVKDVIYEYDDHVAYRYKFLVQCDYGFENKIPIYSVLAGKYKTCGYLNCRYSKTGQAYERFESMIGTKINQLTVEELIYDSSEEIMYYRWKFRCSCTCGNQNYINSVEQFLYRIPYSCDRCGVNSTTEIYFFNWLKENNINSQRKLIPSHNQSMQSKVEIDYILDNKLGIELHGLNTHSTTETIKTLFVGHKNKNYHLNKLLSAQDCNLDLLQFWNNEWYQKQDIVKSIVLNRLNKTLYREYARNCYIQEINQITSNTFLNQNHIQGQTKSDQIRIGLFYKLNNNLVSVMTFGRSRYDSKFEWELLRYSSINYSVIVGGASKLFNYFVKKYNPKSIITYSDRRLFENGKLYNTLGFTFSHNSAPNYWYFKNGHQDRNIILYHRSLFMKHKLANKLDNFDPNLTEFENMERNNYIRVYDCGNKVYFWKK